MRNVEVIWNWSRDGVFAPYAITEFLSDKEWEETFKDISTKFYVYRRDDEYVYSPDAGVTVTVKIRRTI